MIKQALASVALCSVLPAFAATNLLTDGSFESSGVAAGAYDTFSGSDLPGWLALPGDSIEVRNGIVGTGQDDGAKRSQHGARQRRDDDVDGQRDAIRVDRIGR